MLTFFIYRILAFSPQFFFNYFFFFMPVLPWEQHKTHRHVFQQVVRIHLHHLQKWALSHSAGSPGSTPSGLSILTRSVRRWIRSALFSLLPHLQIDCLSHHCDILSCVDGDGISLFTFWQRQFSVLMRWSESNWTSFLPLVWIKCSTEATRKHAGVKGSNLLWLE